MYPAGGNSPAPQTDDASSKKNVRWHVEPHLTTMRRAVERVIRGDDTTTKIANSYGIPARTLRRYVSHEKLAQSRQKLPDGRNAKSILNRDSDNGNGAIASGARGGRGAGASTSTSRSAAKNSFAATGGRPPLSNQSPSLARKRVSQPIAIGNPFQVSRNLDERRRQQQQQLREREREQLQRQQRQAAQAAAESARSRSTRLLSFGLSDPSSTGESFDFMDGPQIDGASGVSPPGSFTESLWDLPQESPSVGRSNPIDAPAPAPSPGRTEKRNRGVSMDLLLEAFGNAPSPGTSLNSNTSARLLVQAETKRRNRADSRELLRMAFTDDDASFQPPSDSLSSQLQRAGRTRGRSTGRSDSFDFSSMQADFNEHFNLPSGSAFNLPRSRGNSMWSNDDGEDMLAGSLDLDI